MINIIMENLFRKSLEKHVSVSGFVLVLSIASLHLNGQNPVLTDTFKIQEVIIPGRQISSAQPGYKFYDIDSLSLKDYSLSPLTDVLDENASLYIKNYGSGGTATSSFRGTLAGHTKVTWNGININDPML